MTIKKKKKKNCMPILELDKGIHLPSSIDHEIKSPKLVFT